jgi:hypothetical protein
MKKEITFNQLKKMVSESAYVYDRNIRYKDILDALADFGGSKEDLEEMVNEDPDTTLDWFADYVSVSGVADNYMHIGAAAQEMARLLLKGRTIASLRKEYGDDDI